MKLFKDKYRILEEDNMFYPQIREYFIWCSWCNFSDYYNPFGPDEVVYFNTLEAATNFIESQINQPNSPKSKKIIHKYEN